MPEHKHREQHHRNQRHKHRPSAHGGGCVAHHHIVWRQKEKVNAIKPVEQGDDNSESVEVKQGHQDKLVALLQKKAQGHGEQGIGKAEHKELDEILQHKIYKHMVVIEILAQNLVEQLPGNTCVTWNFHENQAEDLIEQRHAIEEQGGPEAVFQNFPPDKADGPLRPMQGKRKHFLFLEKGQNCQYGKQRSDHLHQGISLYHVTLIIEEHLHHFLSGNPAARIAEKIGFEIL